jgi:hypothetical protein
MFSSLQFFKINSLSQFLPLTLQFFVERDIGRRDVAGLGKTILIDFVGAEAADELSADHIDLYKRGCTKLMTTLSFLYSLNRV